ncbi:hypothetical protein ACFFX0_29445 [Citricoccus parietis]|uniref:Uncharacterized protein n=1 Tax=Citricoccus parietis TaxID=592307 RepID=A0ABV5G871_9MICC
MISCSPEACDALPVPSFSPGVWPSCPQGAPSVDPSVRGRRPA